MASGNRRGRDWVLGGRQLAGIFMLLVVLFGMVFTLGYLLGRHQYDAQLQAAASILPGRFENAPDRIPDRANEKPLNRKRNARKKNTPPGARPPEKTQKPQTPPAEVGFFYPPGNPPTPAEPLS